MSTTSTDGLAPFGFNIPQRDSQITVNKGETNEKNDEITSRRLNRQSVQLWQVAQTDKRKQATGINKIPDRL